MSADKYPGIFSRQMATIVYVYVASYVGRKSEVKKCGRLRRLSIRRYSARFRRIIVNYNPSNLFARARLV